MSIQTTSYGRAILRIRQYGNGRTAIELISKHAEPIATLTVNIPEYFLAEGEILVKAWNENEEIAADCLASGMFEDTGKRVPTGWVEAQVWRIKED